jgi:hypothetical protein
MTQDEIIEIAKEVYGTQATEQEIRFAKLVADKEREACAKVCDDFSAHYWAKNDAHESVIYEECAAHIRARGQA